MGLLLGLLVGVVGLILYEQSQKTSPAASQAAATGAASATAPSANPVAVAVPAATSGSGLIAATAALPQFDSIANSSIIDLSQQPVFSGFGFSCKNGSIPYYDPSTQVVYCVIPGAAPQSSEGNNIITQGTTSSLFGDTWSEIL